MRVARRTETRGESTDMGPPSMPVMVQVTLVDLHA